MFSLRTNPVVSERQCRRQRRESRCRALAARLVWLRTWLAWLPARHRHIWVAALALAPGAVAMPQGLADEADFHDATADDRMLVVPVAGLDEERAGSIAANVLRRLEDEPDTSFVVFRWDEPSTDSRACESLGEFIFGELRRRAATVAWIPKDVGPLGAAIEPALACREIALGPDVRLAAISSDAPALPEGSRRRIEESCAHYGRPSVLARAMVDSDHDDIYRLYLTKGSNRRSQWTYQGRAVDFLTKRDFDNLEAFDRREFEVIVPRGRPLSMNFEQAREWKFIAENRDPAATPAELLLSFRVEIPLERVDSLGGGPVVRTPPSEGVQGAIDFLHSPVIRTVLIVGGCLGILIEIKMLGAIFPGLIGLTCFVLLFVSSLYPVTGSEVASGTAWEVALFFVGLGLLAVEFLLLPGVAVFAIAGTTLALMSLVLVMVPPDGAGGAAATMTFERAFSVLIFGFGIAGAGFAALLTYLPKWRYSQGLVNRTAIEGVPNADNAVSAQMTVAEYVGAKGKATTPLRPVGRVALDDGRFIDVVADGDYVERGERVVITGSNGLQVVASRIREDAESKETDPAG